MKEKKGFYKDNCPTSIFCPRCGQSLDNQKDITAYPEGYYSCGTCIVSYVPVLDTLIAVQPENGGF